MEALFLVLALIVIGVTFVVGALYGRSVVEQEVAKVVRTFERGEQAIKGTEREIQYSMRAFVLAFKGRLSWLHDRLEDLRAEEQKLLKKI